MASFGRRIKRVTDPLDDRVKARLVGAGYASSGSEHSASVAEDDSPCLSELVHDFLEDDHKSAEQTTGDYASDSDCVDSNLDDADSLEIMIKSAAVSNADSYRNLLMAHVLKAMEMLSFFKRDKAVFRRKVMAYLREAGHNAAICKTRWSSSGGLTAGNYEFIDVLQPASSSRQNRYFVDLDFASEFLIARPTSEYSRLLQYCPKVFVGKKRGIEKDRQGHERFGEKIVEEQRIIPSSMEKKPLLAKQMVRSVPQNDESNPSELQLIGPGNDPSRQRRPMPLRGIRRRRQRPFVYPYEMIILTNKKKQIFTK